MVRAVQGRDRARGRGAAEAEGVGWHHTLLKGQILTWVGGYVKEYVM